MAQLQLGITPTTIPCKSVASNDSQVYSPDILMQPPNPPEQMPRQNQDGGDVNVPGRYFAGRPSKAHLTWAEATQASEVHPVSQWDTSVPVRQPWSTPDGRPRSVLHQVAEVALDIKEASETVLHKYKEDCIEIAKRVSRVSALLSHLENTEIVERQAMKDELTKLLEVFRRAHTLVTACQRSSMITTIVCRLPCKLSEQLNALLDQLLPHVNAIIAVLVNSTLGPQRNRYMGTKNVRGRPQESRSVQPARSIPRGDVGDGENNDPSCYAAAPGDAPESARVISRLEDQE